MAKIATNLAFFIGNTPILCLEKYSKQLSRKATIYAKLEYFNPAGSIKDRIAKAMIDDAETSGLLRSGATIIEPTSGNTGIGLASIAKSRGYKIILTMPETMSIERRKLLQGYGAELVLTEGSKGMSGAISKAEELVGEIPNSYMPSQFTNPANPKTHFEKTGPEIWADTNGNIDIFIAGVGTGGTITGVGEFLKAKNPDIKVVAVEPDESPVLSGGEPGPHKIQGIGAGFIPQILDTDIYDEVFRVKSDEAVDAAKHLAATEGLLVGISSGAAFYAALSIAQREENEGKNIVVIFPDTGERYLSTALFEKD